MHYFSKFLAYKVFFKYIYIYKFINNLIMRFDQFESDQSSFTAMRQHFPKIDNYQKLWFNNIEINADACIKVPTLTIVCYFLALYTFIYM